MAYLALFVFLGLSCLRHFGSIRKERLPLCTRALLYGRQLRLRIENSVVCFAKLQRSFFILGDFSQASRGDFFNTACITKLLSIFWFF